MIGAINRYAINGGASPDWVQRAAAVAVAAALATVSPTKTTYSTATGNAGAVASVSPTHKQVAAATGTAGANGDVSPRLIYAASAAGTAGATGNAAVRRDVYATAAGDATCTGYALAADKLGEATANAAASVVLAKAHIVKPASTSKTCGATAIPPSGLVTRRPTVLASGLATGRAESKKKASGQTFYRHDGYVLGALATATATIVPDRVQIIATFGSFEFADAVGDATAFIRQPGRVYAVGAATGAQAFASIIFGGRVNANAGATGAALGVPYRGTTVLGTAGATRIQARGAILKMADAVGAESVANAISAIARRVTPGIAEGAALATSYPVQAKTVKGGYATAYATTTAILALAATNQEVSAPDARTMIVQSELRGMIVPFEDRLMRVFA